MEGLELICFQIISASGGAKSAYMAALEAAKEGNYEEAENMIKEGDEMLNQGHAPHATLVQQEAARQFSGSFFDPDPRGRPDDGC